MATANPFDIKDQPKPGLVGGTPNQAATFNPAMSRVDEEKETTAGQLKTLLDSGSPLMMRASTQARQEANRRGLINSSIAVGAAQGAVMDALTPIAAQDAQTYSQRALANQNSLNSMGQFNVGELNRFNLQTKAQDFEAGQSALDRAQQERLQSNQFGFQKSESALDRSQQFGILAQQQSFQAGQSSLDRQQQFALLGAQQDFQKAQSDLDRALQRYQTDRGIEAQQQLQAAQQNFQAAQAGLDRAQQTSLQSSQQSFQANQSQLDRVQQLEVLARQQGFQSDESVKERAQQILLADKNISAQQALLQAQQEFTRQEGDRDRSQQLLVLGAQQQFQSAQAELERAQQVLLADKSVAAQQALQTAQQEFASAQSNLDRVQQTNIQKSQQNFQSDQARLDRFQQASMQEAQQMYLRDQAALDRAQQIALTDKSIGAQQALQIAQQKFQETQGLYERQFQSTQAQLDRDQQTKLNELQRQFQSTQAQLDRDQQVKITDFQNSLQQSNVSKAYAASVSANTLQAINAVLADPNLRATVDPSLGETISPKQAAVANIIDAANANLQWASTFYNLSLPGLNLPGSSGLNGVFTPTAGAGASAPVGSGSQTPGPGSTKPGSANEPVFASEAQRRDLYSQLANDQLQNFPDLIVSGTAEQKASFFRRWLDKGYTAEQIRVAIDAPNDAAWQTLLRLAGAPSQAGSSSLSGVNNQAGSSVPANATANTQVKTPPSLTTDAATPATGTAQQQGSLREMLRKDIDQNFPNLFTGSVQGKVDFFNRWAGQGYTSEQIREALGAPNDEAWRLLVSLAGSGNSVSTSPAGNGVSRLPPPPAGGAILRDQTARVAQSAPPLPGASAASAQAPAAAAPQAGGLISSALGRSAQSAPTQSPQTAPQAFRQSAAQPISDGALRSFASGLDGGNIIAPGGRAGTVASGGLIGSAMSQTPARSLSSITSGLGLQSGSASSSSDPWDYGFKSDPTQMWSGSYEIGNVPLSGDITTLQGRNEYLRKLSDPRDAMYASRILTKERVDDYAIARKLIQRPPGTATEADIQLFRSIAGGLSPEAIPIVFNGLMDNPGVIGLLEEAKERQFNQNTYADSRLSDPIARQEMYREMVTPGNKYWWESPNTPNAVQAAKNLAGAHEAHNTNYASGDLSSALHIALMRNPPRSDNPKEIENSRRLVMQDLLYAAKNMNGDPQQTVSDFLKSEKAKDVNRQASGIAGYKVVSIAGL